jgi:predicted lipid-binding transport protein (Tim44 family)
MSLYTIILLPTVLLLAALAMLYSHLRAWREYQRQPLENDERDYRRRQFRRRMQSSTMLGLLGVGLGAGQALMLWFPSPFWLGVFWAAMLLGLLWVGLLALADAWETRHFYGRRQCQCLIERAALEAKLRRIQEGRGNGKPRDNTSPLGEPDDLTTDGQDR